jgi:hypothetical protein
MKAKLLALSVVCLSAIVHVACETLNVGESKPPTFPSSFGFLVLAPTAAEARVGATHKFGAYLSEGGMYRSVPVKWSSSGIASVDPNGVARCDFEGNASIVAESTERSGVSARGTLTCKAALPGMQNLITVSPPSAEVTVNKAATTEQVCTIRIENKSNDPVTLKFTSDHPGIEPSASGSSLAAGGAGNLGVYYKGPQALPFSMTLTLTATASDGEQVIRIPITVGVK